MSFSDRRAVSLYPRKRAFFAFVLLGSALALPTAGLAQTASATAAASTGPVFHGYDVITVKPNKSGTGNTMWSAGDTSMQATNVTVKMLLANATGVRDQLISGLPPWAESEHFDIQAKVVDPDPALKNRKQTREEAEAEFHTQVLSVLEERFHVKTHLETKVQPVYDLVVAKSGNKLKLHDEKAVGNSMTWNNGVLTATGIVMKDFARSIEYESGRSVLDKTGLTGSYDLQLKWTREAQSVNATENGSMEKPPDLFTALQEQLGLKLVSDKAPVSYVVVDTIDPPTLD